jgi:hypothetical protein
MLRKNCASNWFFFTRLYLDARPTKLQKLEKNIFRENEKGTQIDDNFAVTENRIFNKSEWLTSKFNVHFTPLTNS